MSETETRHTFLFADIAGFTALTEAHGDERAADLVSAFCRAVADLLPDCGGEQVKSIGDAVLVRVPDAPAAVRLGLRIVEEVGGRHEFPVVRVGTHTGPAVYRDGDWFGATLNVAARVTAIADGGELLLTEETRRAAGELEGVAFDARGAQILRNVSSPVLLYRARRAGRASRTLPVDPVCRMAVNPAHSHRLLHENTEIHFCSSECALAFSRNPQTYRDVRTAAAPTGAARASDADRERSLDQLKQAGAEGRLTLEELTDRVEQVLEARTRADLAALERDLAPEARPEPAARRGRRWTVAVMGGGRQRGRWRAGDRLGVLALMGGAVLDLRHAELMSTEVRITAIAIMGGVRVLVPDGVRVEGGGVAILGGNEVRHRHTRESAPLPGTPTLRVRAFSLMGGVRVQPSRRRLPSREAAKLPIADGGS